MNANPEPLPTPPRVLVTKIGFDGHDRGSRIVAAYLRDAGMEVIYTPPWQSIEAVVTLATANGPQTIMQIGSRTWFQIIVGIHRFTEMKVFKWRNPRLAANPLGFQSSLYAPI